MFNFNPWKKNVINSETSLKIWSLTFLASTFLYPFRIGDVVVAGFAVEQRPVEEKQEVHVRMRPNYSVFWSLGFGGWSLVWTFFCLLYLQYELLNVVDVTTLGQYLILRSSSSPFYFFGVAGDEEAQGPLLHFHVVSGVYQGAVGIQREREKKKHVLAEN